MKNVMIFLFLAFWVNGYSQIINFPDANFKNALVNTLCVDTKGGKFGDSDADLNNDGEIDVSEALKVKGLYINNQNIMNMDGIQHFTSVSLLNCAQNKLASLNIEELKKLEYLYCGGNELTSISVQGLLNLSQIEVFSNKLDNLNLQGLINLKSLDISNNQFSSLNVEGLVNLEVLQCGQNQLTSLNLEGLINLKILNIYNNHFTSLNVEGLVKLEGLLCDKNGLTSLNVKGLSNLFQLSFSENKITSINLEGLLSLEYLYCHKNQLTTLNAEGLRSLIHLYCYRNQLTSINLEGLSNLEVFLCGQNQLSSINTKGLVNLKELSFDDNLFKSFDAQELVNLEHLYFNNNLLTTLNVQQLKKLKSLRCIKNQLTSLNVNGLTNLRELTFYWNQISWLFMKGTQYHLERFDYLYSPSLSYICCDEWNITQIKTNAKFYGLNTEVNSYCTFSPGGNFYTIQGQNLYDENSNGCGGQVMKIQNIKYKLANFNFSGTISSNSTGSYSIPVQYGTHTITPILENPDYFEITPSSFTVTFPSTSDTINQNFCITPNGILRQTNITVLPLTPPARPGFDASYKIVWENVGNQIESGTLNFTYDERLLDYISATQTADQIADGIVKWNFTNLLPFEKREITVTLKVNRPTDTPAVNAGDKLYLTASILDNIFTLENTVVGSYDPNDKTCLQGDRVKPDMVGKYVDYLIRFENTGNYAAENVVIKDIIDTKTFDVSSLQITDASHEVYTRIEGNKVEFIFENIQLPFDDANNDGYVAFKIKTLPTLVLGDSLKNLADIYFDYNFPIRTNEAQTTIALPSFTKDFATEVNVYPNPVRDILYLESDENWSKAEIYDISGRILRSVSLFSQSIDVSGLECGTYFMRLKGGEKVGVVKFVKI